VGGRKKEEKGEGLLQKLHDLTIWGEGGNHKDELVGKGKTSFEVY